MHEETPNYSKRFLWFTMSWNKLCKYLLIGLYQWRLAWNISSASELRAGHALLLVLLVLGGSRWQSQREGLWDGLLKKCVMTDSKTLSHTLWLHKTLSWLYIHESMAAGRTHPREKGIRLMSFWGLSLPLEKGELLEGWENMNVTAVFKKQSQAASLTSNVGRWWSKPF